jgi:ABC-type microcin C transport system permease subunit YejB
LRRLHLFPWTEHKEACNVLTNFPVFHAEYWVYALAGLVVIVVGTLLYTVEAPIKFSSWF